MCFQNFVMPSLSALQGVSLQQKRITAAAGENVVNRGQRTDFLRVDLTNEPGTSPTFMLVSRQGSHMLTSIVEADGYIALEPGGKLQQGDLAELYVF